MSAEYKKAQAAYADAAAKASNGDKAAHKEKAKLMNDIRAIERDSARNGTILSYVPNKGEVVTKSTSSKRSLQEEYVRKFDDKTPVQIDGKTTTLQEHHRKRLFK